MMTNSSLADAYGKKESAYFQAARQDIVDDLAPHPEVRVLEIGCGTGATGALAKATCRVSRYVGIEIDAAAAAQARLVLDEVVEGNIEQLTMPFAPQSFDVFVLSEVLEHLIDPWAVLKKLGPLLAPRGVLYASSPNVAHFAVLRMLMRNRWDYSDHGRMDWTHLRWFTPQTYREMIEAAGFRTIWMKPLAGMTAKQRVANAMTLGRFAHIFMSQIFIKAERN
jgi:SAM-dependent methyltransferase